MMDPQAVQTTNDAVSGAFSQVAVAALVTYFIEWMKNSDHPLFKWINEHKTGLLRALNAALAAVAAVGVHYTFDPTAGTLTVTGLQASAIAHALWEWAKQWAFQQVTYDAVVSKQRPPAGGGQ